MAANGAPFSCVVDWNLGDRVLCSRLETSATRGSAAAVVEFLGGPPAQVPEHYREASPMERSIPQAAQKLVHGTADDSVPYEISKGYYEQKKKAGENVELITLEKTDHFQIIDPSSAVWRKVQQIFVSLTGN